MRLARDVERHEWWVATDFSHGPPPDAGTPGDDFRGWMACCECGWRGRPYTRVRWAEEEDRAARRVHSAGRLEPFWVLNEMGHEWLAHLKENGTAA